MISNSFSRLELPADVLANLASLGYQEMTPIQAAALPMVLNGADVIAQAKTGSGKTAVFSLGLLGKLDQTRLIVQSLVMCPTRELSIQVANEIRRIARHRQNIKVTVLYGGQPISLQKQSLKHGTHIVVGTPGRIKDHLEKGTLRLDQIQTLVLDEADRMLEMGFIEDITAIIAATPTSRQTLMFSATFPDNIRSLSKQFQVRPEHIIVDDRHEVNVIRQLAFLCEQTDKLNGLVSVLAHEKSPSTIVFCNFKQSTRDVCEFLSRKGISALALNGDLEQREREEILIQFKHQSVAVLVATDVAARGLDIHALPLVVNFELPPDPQVYTHRVGRTGRAGKTGAAISLCTGRERHKVDVISESLKLSIPFQPIETIESETHRVPKPANVTFCISGGRKDKIRPGEILGALTGKDGLEGKDVGKIDVTDYASYVAVSRNRAVHAEQMLKRNKIKGRSFKIRAL